MRRSHLLALCLLASTAVQANEVYKCRNEKGVITYSYQACASHGYQNADAMAGTARREDIIGGWISDEDSLVQIRAGLNANGTYEAEITSLMGMKMIDFGTWELNNNKLDIRVERTLQVFQNNAREKHEESGRSLRINNIKNDSVEIITRDALTGADEKHTFTRTKEPYKYVAPDPVEQAKRHKKLLANNCKKMQDTAMYDQALLACQAAAAEGDAKSAFAAAQMFWSGQGTSVNEDEARRYYQQAQQGGVKEAAEPIETVFNDFMRRWPFELAPKDDSVIGSWCITKSGPSLDRMTTDNGRIQINADGSFRMLNDSAISTRGRWSQQADILKLGTEGEFGILSQSADKMTLRNNNSYVWVRGNCDTPSRNMGIALQLDNAIVIGSQPYIDSILASGHNINTANTRSLSETTPLIQAIKSGNKELVKRLLEMGADAGQPDATGRSPLEIARKEKEEEIVQLLLGDWPLKALPERPPASAVPAGSFAIAIPESEQQASNKRRSDYDQQKAMLDALDTHRLYPSKDIAELMLTAACEKNQDENATDKAALQRTFGRLHGGIMDERKLDLSVLYYLNNEEFMKRYSGRMESSMMRCMLFSGV